MNFPILPSIGRARRARELRTEGGRKRQSTRKPCAVSPLPRRSCFLSHPPTASSPTPLTELGSLSIKVPFHLSRSSGTDEAAVGTPANGKTDRSLARSRACQLLYPFLRVADSGTDSEVVKGSCVSWPRRSEHFSFADLARFLEERLANNSPPNAAPVALPAKGTAPIFAQPSLSLRLSRAIRAAGCK